MTNQHNPDEDLRRLAHMIKDIKFTMLTSVNDDGSMHSRPMATQKIDEDTFDGRLWFFTKKNAGKVHEIEHDQHVNLAYASLEKQHFVSVSGRAFVTNNEAKMAELWTPALNAWFPEGLDDPEISLIGVTIETAEIWDTPSSKLIHAYGIVKSAIIGKPFEQTGHSERLRIQPS